MIWWLPFIFLSQAQSFPEAFQTDTQILTQHGSLVSVSIARGQPMKIYVVGREAVEVDFSKTSWDVALSPEDLSLTVRRIGPKFSEFVKIKRQKNFFVMSTPSQNEPVYTLEVTTETHGKTEKFNFKIDNRPK